MEFVYLCQKFSSFSLVYSDSLTYSNSSSTQALVQSLLDKGKSVGKKYFSAFILQHKNGKLASKRV